MKSGNLLYPYSWEERRPVLKGSVFYVPNYYQEHDRGLFPALDLLFGNQNPTHVEYCSGNGEWVIERALSHPGLNWIAVEKKFNRVRKIHSKSHNHGLKNLSIIAGRRSPFPVNISRITLWMGSM